MQVLPLAFILCVRRSQSVRDQITAVIAGIEPALLECVLTQRLFLIKIHNLAVLLHYLHFYY